MIVPTFQWKIMENFLHKIYGLLESLVVCSRLQYQMHEYWKVNIIPRIGGHQWVPAGPWSLGSRSLGPLFIPTHEKGFPPTLWITAQCQWQKVCYWSLRRLTSYFYKVLLQGILQRLTYIRASGVCLHIHSNRKWRRWHTPAAMFLTRLKWITSS